jgi:predicted nucleic acid-binding protein
MIYADTSVIVPYYTLEKRSADADAILRDRTDVFVSDLGVAEFHVTMARKIRDKVLTRTAARKAIDLFETHFGADCPRKIRFDVKHVERVRAIAARIDVPVRTLDAFHLAFAQELGATVATFDERLGDAAKAHGFKVIT